MIWLKSREKGKQTTEKQKQTLVFIAEEKFSLKNMRDYCLVILGRDRVAALRLIGPFRGSRTRLSNGILLK